jgi:predicted ATP-dependent endonuclease of OLD family
MFINKIKISNFRCFGASSPEIVFRKPDGTTAGSGLNILVGENGTGKTTLLEAINYLTESNYVSQNKLSVSDFKDEEYELVIEADTEPYTYKMPEIYRGSSFECDGLLFKASLRKQKSPGRLLSPSLQVSTSVKNSSPKYVTPKGNEGKVEEYHKLFDDSRLEEELNIFYFDKFRSRHITRKDSYKTTFNRIIDDLNWRFNKAMRDSEETRETLVNLSKDLFPRFLELAQKGVGDILAKKASDFFGQSKLKDLKIDFLNLMWPFSDAFFALRTDDSINQIPINKLGSGIEMIVTLLLLKSIYEQSKGKLIYLIDEPELSLHPQAQAKLFELLIEESKDKQVFISTHSTHFTSPDYSEAISRFYINESSEVAYRNIPHNIDIKEERNFFFRHRNLFFSTKAVFVEGIEDSDRYSRYLDINNIPDISEHFFLMNGCDQTLFFEKLCTELNIKFCALVDKDFSYTRSKWSRENRKRFIKDIKQLISENDITFDEKAFDTAITKELEEKPRKDVREVEEFDVNGEKIWKVKEKNIFVLSHGEIRDYLNQDGTVVEDLKEEKEKELKAIFSAIENIVNE